MSLFFSLWSRECILLLDNIAAPKRIEGAQLCANSKPKFVLHENQRGGVLPDHMSQSLSQSYREIWFVCYSLFCSTCVLK